MTKRWSSVKSDLTKTKRQASKDRRSKAKLSFRQGKVRPQPGSMLKAKKRVNRH